MRLSELLEKQSIKSISLKTMISEDNIEKIVAEDYVGLTKAKALGFLSILEREYGIDLKDVRHNAMSYFEMNHTQEESINIALPKVEEKRGHSKWIIVVILALFGYASWYFFTKFDQKRLHDMLPFAKHTVVEKDFEQNDSIWSINHNALEIEKSKENSIPKDNNTLAQSMIKVEAKTKTSVVQADIAIEKRVVTQVSSIPPENIHSVEIKNNETNDTIINISAEKNITQVVDAYVQIKEVNKMITEAVIKPVKRLWFGLINMQTGKKDHFSVRKGYTIDLTQGDYLVATSPAPFSLAIKGEIYHYNNGRSHYFKITKSGLTPLSKKRYLREGGYKKWQ